MKKIFIVIALMMFMVAGFAQAGPIILEQGFEFKVEKPCDLKVLEVSDVSSGRSIPEPTPWRLINKPVSGGSEETHLSCKGCMCPLCVQLRENIHDGELTSCGISFEYSNSSMNLGNCYKMDDIMGRNWRDDLVYKCPIYNLLNDVLIGLDKGRNKGYDLVYKWPTYNAVSSFFVHTNLIENRNGLNYISTLPVGVRGYNLVYKYPIYSEYVLSTLTGTFIP